MSDVNLSSSAVTAKDSKFFYGWKIVFVAMLCQGMSLGLFSSAYSFYIPILENEFGASRSQSSMGLSVLMLLVSIVAIFFSKAIDKGAVKAVMAGGVIIASVGLVAVSLSDSLFMMALWFWLLCGSGLAMYGAMPSAALVNNWFDKKRSIALGIGQTGMSFAGFCIPFIIVLLINSIGWRMALVAIAAVLLILVLPIILKFVVKHPQDMGLKPDGNPDYVPVPTQSDALGDVFSDRFFWIVVAIFSLIYTSSTTITMNMIAFAGSLSISPEDGALLVSAIAGVAFFGKLFFGWLNTHWGSKVVLLIIVSALGIGWTVMITSQGFYELLGGIIIYSFAFGGSIPLQATLIADRFGSHRFARVYGVNSLLMMPVFAVIPPLVGVIYDQSNSYVTMLQPFIAGFVLCFILVLALPKKPA
ncbi:hypothetical protein SIN8267_00401 [Sinobacterium norvegicum]|uniref:Major facilitator superfamily (MFS) profile domain-containing protein n=1 Tax=Sinobacterium norvegicum TaxID=1641715 RepID=A0ABM9ACE2_9GAMM|nr:MFS transporter [Sinobacterium norvegicum]CAH0990309.1 hypothetical protein SIN8267_00401 [Sinobacterium norvegicum]